MKIYCNGEVKEKDTLEEIFEPGFLFGWGVFETMRAYQSRVAFLNEHIKRLNDGLDLLGIEKVNLNWDETIRNLLRENKLEDAYVRITAHKKRKGTGILIYTDVFGYYPPEVYKKGFTALISPHKRNQEDICAKVKSISYLNNRLSWFEAQKKKKSEALVLNYQGNVVGGARSNIFLINNGVAFTPSVKSGAFEGVTRQKVIEILGKLGIEVKEKNITLSDMLSCEEVFLTSSLLEIMPLVEVDDKKIKDGVPGKTTKQIHSQYKELIHSK